MKNINWTDLLLFVLFFTVIFSCRYHIDKSLFKRIKVCSSYGYEGFNIQDIVRISKVLPSQYRLNEYEIDMAKDILAKYQENIIFAYFKETLSTKLVFLNMPSETYFIFSFFEFLHKHSCEYSFHNHTMHKYVSKKDSIKTCSLTDFGIVFYKLYYIACVFCETDSYITKKNLFHYDSILIKENLDKGEIELMSFPSY